MPELETGLPAAVLFIGDLRKSWHYLRLLAAENRRLDVPSWPHVPEKIGFSVLVLDEAGEEIGRIRIRPDGSFCSMQFFEEIPGEAAELWGWVLQLLHKVNRIRGWRPEVKAPGRSEAPEEKAKKRAGRPPDYEPPESLYLAWGWVTKKRRRGRTKSIYAEVWGISTKTLDRYIDSWRAAGQPDMDHLQDETIGGGHK